MNTLINSIASTITTGIEAEVSMQRDEANNRIGRREAAREFINERLQEMPVIVEGDHLVTYLDDREEEQTKSQSKNFSLWTVTLQTTIETGHITYELLGGIFRSWAKETLGCDWPMDQAIAIATKFVEAMRDMDILARKKSTIEFISKETKQPMKSSVNVLSEDFQEAMENTIEEMRQNTHMVCRPLTNKPEDWVNTEEGVGVNAGLKLIKGQRYFGNMVSKKVLDAVNKLQSVEFVVSPAMIDAAYDILDNPHEFDCTEEEIRMYREILQYENGSYYFPVTMDTRGRMYYRGGLLSPQGTDFCKAAFQFAEHKALGEDGFKAICIHTANMLGYDKLSIEDRIQTVEQLIYKDQLNKIQDHNDVKATWPKANVFQATVAIRELNRIVRNCEKGSRLTEIQSNLVCHQDGTCNGLQHMAAITHNKQTAIAVNCVESSKNDLPADIYQIIADQAAKMTTGEAHELIVKYGRSMAKNPVMITGYGAGKETIIKNTTKYLAEKKESLKYAETIGESYVLALEHNAGAVKVLTDALKGRMQSALEKGIKEVFWKTADGFRACTEYRDVEVNRVRAGVFNALLRNNEEAPLDEVKTIGAMAPNFIHSIDATHLRLVVNDCDHPLVAVHDSIGSHPSTYFATAQSIREKFVEVHEYNALEDLCKRLDVRTPKFRGEYNASEALKSSYIFS